MITFAFDRKGPHGFVPNLVERTDIVPESNEWWDLCNIAPHATEFKITKYLELEDIPYQRVLVEDLTDSAVYPINLQVFDPNIGYFKFISELALDKCRDGKLKIVFYFENPIDTMAFEKYVIEFSQRHRIDNSLISVITVNKPHNDKGRFYYFPRSEFDFHHSSKNIDYVRNVNTKIRNKKFTCISEYDTSITRLFGATLWYQGLSSEGYFKYSEHDKALGITNNSKDSSYKFSKFWKDPAGLMENFIMHVPFSSYAQEDLSGLDIYSNSYWNIVMEANFSKSKNSLSDAVFKSILNLQPFVIVGPPGSLKLLNDQGYETFDYWISEKYDRIKNDEERLHTCFQVLYEIASMDSAQLTKMTKEIIPVLAHNQQVFLSSKKEKLSKLLRKIQ